MTDMTEKETIEYFQRGLKKASSAALQLAKINERAAWHQIVRALDQLAFNGMKYYTGKAQTRLQTLALAAKIQNETAH